MRLSRIAAVALLSIVSLATYQPYAQNTIGPAYGEIGSGGAGFTLGPGSNIHGVTSGTTAAVPAPAANRAAAEATRDAYYVANPGFLATYDTAGNEALGIFIIYTSGSETVSQGQTRVGSAWVDSVSTIGIQGTPGATGIGSDRMFDSVTERDEYFGAPGNNFPNITLNHIISVGVGDDIENQIWQGVASPSSYDANNWLIAGSRIAGGSLSFQGELEISNYGEFPKFLDRINDITALPVGQRYTEAGGSQGARQVFFQGESDLVVTAEDADSALQAVHSYTLDTTGAITNPAIILSGTINFLVAPNYYIVEIWRGTDDTGTKVFTGREEPNGVTGVYIGRPASPQRLLPNTTYFIRFTGDIPFQYRTAAGTTGPAGTLTGFEFTFQDLATQDFVTNNAGENNVQSDWDETNTASDAFILNKPTIPAQLTTEQIQDIAGGMVTGNTQTGITVTYDDANGKINFVVGTPPTGTGNFYTGLSSSNNPASVDINTLTSQSVGTGSGQQFTFSVGPATLNDYVIILAPAVHDISTLINTGTGFSVLDSFTKTDDVRTITSVSYDSYTLGPLVDTFSANYRATLN